MGSKAGVVVLLFIAALIAAGRSDAASLKLFHDTFDPAYRRPFGAVPARTKVTLRLRVTGGKAKSVTLRVAVGNGKTKNVHMLRRGAFWSATVRMPAAPAIVHYDFRVRERLRVLWYGDNGDADVIRGGTGITTSQELIPFTITVYAPSFE